VYKTQFPVISLQIYNKFAAQQGPKTTGKMKRKRAASLRPFPLEAQFYNFGAPAGKWAIENEKAF